MPPPLLPCQHPSLLLPALLRSFSTTSPPGARSSVSQLKQIHSTIPPYPYPPSRTYKQSNFGLYGNSHIQFGNKISGKNEIKTRRRWYPNIQSKRLWSESLGKFLQVKVQARVLRTIDKVGGLDEYLLGGKRARVKELGMGGWELRWRIWQTDMVTERFRREREALGVPEGGWEGLIRKMKREGKGKGKEEKEKEKEKERRRRLEEDTKLEVVRGKGKDELELEDVKEEEPSRRGKAFMEEETPLSVKNSGASQPPAGSR